MGLIEVYNKNFEGNEKLSEKLVVFQKLLEEVNKHKLPEDVQESINLEIEKINAFTGKDNKLLKVLVRSQLKTLRILEAKLGLVPKKYYQNTWMAVGIAIGISIGVAIGTATNMGMMAIGLPIGLGIGLHLGKKKDDEVFKNGKQLDVEIEQSFII